MSFILDALKKADAERHLGQMPGIHTQQTPALELPNRTASPYAKLYPAVPVAAAIALAAAIGILFWQAAKEETPASVLASTSSPVAPAPARPAPAVPTPAEPEPEPAKEERLETEPLIANELPVPPPLPEPEPVAKQEAAPSTKAPAARKPASAALANKEAVTADAPAKSAAPQPRIMSMNELPADVRSELPPLAVKGSMYSDNPANRILLLDKRLLHEGDEIAPGLVLETLMPKAATLRYKQYRFQIAF